MKKETITLRSVSKSFSNGENVVHVLHDISLTTYEQELIMLMGPSGSGKTTLLSIIGGILNQDAGECLVLNRPINTLATAEKIEFRGNNIGFMFQHFMLIPTLTVLENAAIGMLCLGHSRKDAIERAAVMLTELDLGNQLHKMPEQLSGGEQQRVAIARACLHHPKILLCDEPTSFLDLERGKKVMSILQSIKEKTNCTIIVITHDPRILEYANRVIRIEDGKLVLPS